MKVYGFTFIRNAIQFDYPIVEAIKSILPVCDKVIVAVGNSEDGTLDLIKGIDPEKIIIEETIWDDSLREGGRVLAAETDKALALVPDNVDWAFYIQGDEVVHEKYLPEIKAQMETYKDQKNVDGLLFHYEHFFGSYDYVGASTNWYKREIRIIKPNRKIHSYGDAQGFRKADNQKLNVIPINAYIYHYGWIREPKAQQKKLESFHRLWHDEKWIDENLAKAENFDYEANMTELRLFQGTHPEIMKERIARKNWKFDTDISLHKKKFKDRFKDAMLKYFGWNLSYQNYKIVK